MLPSTLAIDPCTQGATASYAPTFELSVDSSTGTIRVDGAVVRNGAGGADSLRDGVPLITVQQTDGPDLRVFKLAGLSLPDTVNVNVGGAFPVGIAVCGDLLVDASFNLDGKGFAGGRFADVTAGTAGQDSTTGGRGGTGDADGGYTGGGGGANGADGGRGRANVGGGPFANGGDVDFPSVLPVRFGGSGGGGGRSNLPFPPSGTGTSGGNGGGALYLYATGTLTCNAAHFSAKGGAAAFADQVGSGGGGGGAGGSIFLEATSIDVAAGCVFDTSGGKGGDADAAGGAGGTGATCRGADGGTGAGGGGSCGRVGLRARALRIDLGGFVSPDAAGAEVIDVP